MTFRDTKRKTFSQLQFIYEASVAIWNIWRKNKAEKFMIHSFAQFEAHLLSWRLIWWHVAENQKYRSVRTGLDSITAVSGNLKQFLRTHKRTYSDMKKKKWYEEWLNCTTKCIHKCDAARFVLFITWSLSTSKEDRPTMLTSCHVTSLSERWRDFVPSRSH